MSLSLRFAAIGLASALLGSPALALTVTSAKIAKGAVQVKGTKATPLAPITWGGQVVAEANRRGAFRFATATLPAGCIGDLSDGSAVVKVVLQSCGPPGPKGDPGPVGSPAPAVPSLYVADSVGDPIGATDGTRQDCFTGNGPQPVHGCLRLFLRSAGRLLRLGLVPDGSALAALDSNGELNSSPLYHANSDCTGDAFVGQVNNETFFATPMSFRGSAVVFPASDDVAERTWLSSEDTGFFAANQAACDTNYGAGHSTFIPPNRCCVSCQGCSTLTGNPAVLFDLNSLGFQPPFHIEGS